MVHLSGAASTGSVALSGSGPAAAIQSPANPFAGVLKGLVAGTAAADHNAEQAVVGLLSGRGVDVHEAMIATQKADIAFELALQVRNKAVGAYQQMMSMQF